MLTRLLHFGKDHVRETIAVDVSHLEGMDIVGRINHMLGPGRRVWVRRLSVPCYLAGALGIGHKNIKLAVAVDVCNGDAHIG
jgi:hypothetical protein